MKKITKTLALLLAFVLTLCLLSSCGDNDDKKRSVSTNDVINQSVTMLEDMMDIEDETTAALPTSFVSPNYSVDYAHERLSVLRGSGTGLYFSKFLADENNGFKDDVLYKDSISESGVTANVYVEKANYAGGVFISLEMHQTQGSVTRVSPIQIYFEYDYSAKKPTRTSIISASSHQNNYSVSVAQFDYLNNVAYSYNFQLSTEDALAFKTQLQNESLTFDKFVEYDVATYLFAVLDTNNNTIESYAYNYTSPENSEASADYEDVETLYGTVYSAVKKVCAPVENFDVSKATQKVYYANMWAYAMDKVQKIQ